MYINELTAGIAETIKLIKERKWLRDNVDLGIYANTLYKRLDEVRRINIEVAYKLAIEIKEVIADASDYVNRKQQGETN